MAEQAVAMSGGEIEVTSTLARFASTLQYENIPTPALQVAKQCLLDWLGVTLAGTDDQTSEILLAEVLEDGGAPQATILRYGHRTCAKNAALVNGTFSHALDYDDVNAAMPGHPSVPVIPAVLALAEKTGASGSDVLTAIVAGIEVECYVGQYLTQAHYLKGWHATGTLGTLGAAAATARLLGLDPNQTAMALGIAGTQAAGMKSMFGTMCKPLHAGKAATNGLAAALLARRGFTSRVDALECVQGFAETHSPDAPVAESLNGLGQVYFLPETLFKFHAACYGTHASIDAATKVRRAHAPSADDIEHIEVRVPSGNLRMCNISRPTTGLEAKFSLSMTTTMGLLGEPTDRIDAYNEALCRRQDLVGVGNRLRVVGDDDMNPFTSEVIVSLRNSVVVRELADAGKPACDLDDQGRRLEEKFVALAKPIIGTAADEAIAAVRDFQLAKSVDHLIALCVEKNG